MLMSILKLINLENYNLFSFMCCCCYGFCFFFLKFACNFYSSCNMLLVFIVRVYACCPGHFLCSVKLVTEEFVLIFVSLPPRQASLFCG